MFFDLEVKNEIEELLPKLGHKAITILEKICLSEIENSDYQTSIFILSFLAKKHSIYSETFIEKISYIVIDETADKCQTIEKKRFR